MMLPSVQIGNQVRVVNVTAINPTLRKRLISFGIKENSIVCIKQKSLFNGACILECGGRRIGLRKRDLMKIEVESL